MTRITPIRIRAPRFGALALAFVVFVVPAFAAPALETQIGGGGISWQISRPNDGATLSVYGEDGSLVQHKNFESGVTPAFQPAADGAYRWELAVRPLLTDEQKAELAAARARNAERAATRFDGFVASGRFVVQAGVIRETGLDLGGDDRDNPTRDQVIADDLIVTSSICVGFDCVNGESFGFDTIRLKENSTRIKFEDTSVGTFPSNDWQLTANDSASGGLNKFSIEDITGARVPFTIEAGAATNAIFVDSTSRVGFRTAAPVLDLHIATSNTPAIRLEQNASGGFTAQTWDIAGNEANFFVRDVTSGSRLPFRIRPGAPTSSIDVNASGFVGIGTAAPAKKLHVLLNNATNDTAFKIENNQAVRFDLVNTAGGNTTTWFFQADNNTERTLRIAKEGGGGTIVAINTRADGSGLPTMVVDGTVKATNFDNSSSRTFKTDGEKVDPQEVLGKIAGLEIEKWRFHHEREGVRHLGPYAEDFRAAFGLGTDDQHISMVDAAGVSLVAIQALHERVLELEKQNAELRKTVEALAGEKP